MKQRTADAITALLAGMLAILCLYLFIQEAGATSYKEPVKLEQGQAQGQAQQVDVASTADSASSAEQSQTAQGGASSSSSSNDGVQVDASDQSSVENNSSNVVLVPSNNTESCVRVWGIAFGKDGTSGALGIPWRSKRCDLEQAADDAFAGGERDLGWFWKCHNKSLYKAFQSKGESAESAIDDCHTRMLATTSTSDVVRKLEERLQATENMLELQKSHQAVCDESLERCADKVYGSK